MSLRLHEHGRQGLSVHTNCCARPLGYADCAPFFETLLRGRYNKNFSTQAMLVFGKVDGVVFSEKQLSDSF